MADDNEFEVVDRKSSADSSASGSFENVNGTASNTTKSSEKSSEVDPGEDSLKETDNVDDKEVNLLHSIMKPGQEQFYTAEDSRRAIANLVIFSAAMFILPLLTMFSMYYYIFIDYFHIAGPQAMLYAGLCGMVVVIFIVGLFIRVAYKEEKDAEHRLMEQKKDK